MPPRRSHKKSRAGCRRCKSRKIKCNEIHPRCGNCVKHGVACDFEHLELAESLLVPDTPATHGASSPNFFDSPATSRAPSTPLQAGNNPLTMYRNPGPHAISTTSKDNRMMELRLLHHYTTVTCKTLAISDSVDEIIWRDTVPNLAFSGNNFLADALLAVAALHLRSHAPADHSLVRASHSYMAASLSEFGSNLRRGINENNAEALFLTASLIAFQSTASRIFVRDDGGNLSDRNDAYVVPLSWFHSFQGVKAVVASSWHWLRNSGIVVPIIQSQPALNLNMSSQETTFFGSLLEGVNDELASLEDDPGTRLITRQAYQHAVAVINWAHKIPHSGAPMVFLATVSRRYIELLQARRPRALAILACFFGLLKSLDTVWWLKGVARREILGVVGLFDPEDEEWWPRLQWPVQIALHEGDNIPAEVWGADLTAEKAFMDHAQSNGGFISHIDMLSQMFSAMQNMPPDLASDSIYHAYSAADDLISASALVSQTQLQDGLYAPPVD